MGRTLLLLSAMALAVAASGQRGDMQRGRGMRPGGDISREDRMFLDKAAQGGRAEVALGRIASRNASRPGVRDFGNRMVTDHSRANAELEGVARRLHVQPAGGLGEGGDAMSRLRSMRGRDFDRRYVDMMVEDHRKDVAEFQNEAQNGRNPMVRDFARRTLPTLRDHLRMAQMLQSRTGR